MLPAHAIAATAVASVLVHTFVSPDTELETEAVSWVSLAIISRVAPALYGQSQYEPKRGSSIAASKKLTAAQKLVIGAVILGSLSRVVSDTRWIAPLLIPVIAAMRLAADAAGPSHPDASVHASRQRVMYRHAFISALCFILLLSARRLGVLDVPAVLIHGVSVTALLVHLNAVSRDVPNNRDSEKLGPGLPGRVSGRGGAEMVISVAGTLALCMVILAAVAALLGFFPLNGVLGMVLLGGLCKAAWWVAAIQLTRVTPWEATLGIETVTLCWSYGWEEAPFLGHMLLIVSAGLMSLVQLYSLLPANLSSAASRLRPLFVLLAILCIVIPLPALSGKGDIAYLPDERHPVEQLHAAAAENFEALLDRQSQTLAAAAAEYRRRYARDPPPGFDKWFEYARRKKSPIIDDFDMIDEGLRPLWRHSALQFNDTVAEAAKWNLNIVRCGIEAGNFTVGDCGMFGERIGELLGEVKTELPNITFAVNLLDEPGVLPLVTPNAADSDLWRLISGRPASEPIAAACVGRAPLQPRFVPKTPINTHGMAFVTDVMGAKDICQHPEYSTSHGFLLGPSTFAYSRRTFPLLSRAAPHPYSDILFPSPHYVREGEMYDTANDVPWEDKINGLYWAGKATGIQVSDGSWRQGHRQRLVALADNPPYTYLTGSNAATSLWAPFRSSDFDSWIFHTHISELVQCSLLACLSEARALRPSQYLLPSDGFAEPYQYRLALDIDGNSYSGRFYRLLASGSLTLKATLFREWHDDRLVPWYHYVPVSVSLDELPELVRFLARTERGRTLARQIAERGREWHGKALRGIDMSVYLYRLILELARLLDPTRPSGQADGAGGGFKG